jgi:hypothetical protein
VALDWRELIENDEEALMSLLDYVRGLGTAAQPVQVDESTEQGHTVKLQPMVKRQRIKPDGTIEHYKVTTLDEVPIRFQRGGGVITTHPVSKGDVGLWVPIARDFTPTMKKDGVQEAGSTRINNLSDGFFLPGFRPDPQHKDAMGKDGKRYSKTTHQTRSDDGKHTRDTNPKGGITDKSVHKDDKTDKEGNPFADAKKFSERTTLGDSGIARRVVVDKDKEHQHEIETGYDDGHKIGVGNSSGKRNHYLDLHPDDSKAYKLSVKKDKHYHKVNDSDGHKLSAENDAHSLELKTGGAKLKSDTKVTNEAPITEVTQDLQVGQNANIGGILQAAQGVFGSISVAGGGGGGGGGGGIGADSLAAGAAAENVGELGGALTGLLPDPGMADGAVKLRNLQTLYVYRAISDVNSHALSGAEMSGGIVEVFLDMTGAITANRNLSLPTVADLIAAIPGGVAVGNSFKLRVRSNVALLYNWTVVGNTGWTLVGTMTIGPKYVRDFYVTFTAADAATLQSVACYLTVA